MNEKQAIEKGYHFTGIYGFNKEGVEQAAATERLKGNKAVTVYAPSSPLSRGNHGGGWKAMIKKSETNLQAERITQLDWQIKNIESKIIDKEKSLGKLGAELFRFKVVREEELQEATADIPAPVTEPDVVKFQVGTTYCTRSAADYDTIFSFKVVKRTAKTVWLEEGYGREINKRRIYVYGDVEMVRPYGSYSMAPVIRANRTEV